ncbi:ERF family protein [Paracoccus versutus]
MNDLSPIDQSQSAPAPGSKILTALAKAMGEMKRLAKESRNTEQKYDFASVDDFLAMTGPICAANGLVTLMDEVGVENFEKQGKYGVTFWARYTFAITTYHSSGDALPTVRRSVEVIRSGAQAAGSAQSYALKQYQRALYQIPTGDKDDPDHGAVTERQQQDDAPAQKKRSPEDSTFDVAAAAARIKATLSKQPTVADLKDAWESTKEARREIHDHDPAMHDEIKAVLASRKAELEATPAEIIPDEIPF